jgi:tRNA (cytidine/uridine-2'-O-)-methyltransferase
MPNPLLHVVLHQPEIPYNAGNAGRTCVALGAKLWMVRPLGFIVDGPHIRRAGLDYWKHLDYQIVDDWQQLLAQLPTDRLWLMTKTAARPHTAATFEPGDALVFGQESSGLPPDVLSAHADRALRIPMRPEVRSLNLAVSVGIVGYEAQRQLAARGLADLC